jgi:hypothetical protein
MKRVIFRAITPKDTLCNFPAKTGKLGMGEWYFTWDVCKFAISKFQCFRFGRISINVQR